MGKHSDTRDVIGMAIVILFFTVAALAMSGAL